MLEFLTKQENFILDWTGVIILVIGFIGATFTFFFDQIARKEAYMTFGWLQIVGILCFVSLAVFGLFVDGYLREIKEILKDYVKK